MRAVFLFLLCSLVPALALVFDVSIFGARVSEASITEALQSIFLAYTLVCFALLGRQVPQLSTAAYVLALFGLVALIREQDFWLDQLIYHGAWLPFATAVLAMSLGLLVWRFSEFRRGLRDMATRRAFAFIVFGAVFVLIQSRVFGTGRIWEQILEPEVALLVKTLVQEGLELTGYTLMALASFELLRRYQRIAEANK